MPAWITWLVGACRCAAPGPLRGRAFALRPSDRPSAALRSPWRWPSTSGALRPPSAPHPLLVPAALHLRPGPVPSVGESRCWTSPAGDCGAPRTCSHRYDPAPRSRDHRRAMIRDHLGVARRHRPDDAAGAGGRVGVPGAAHDRGQGSTQALGVRSRTAGCVEADGRGSEDGASVPEGCEGGGARAGRGSEGLGRGAGAGRGRRPAWRAVRDRGAARGVSSSPGADRGVGEGGLQGPEAREAVEAPHDGGGGPVADHAAVRGRGAGGGRSGDGPGGGRRPRRARGGFPDAGRLLGRRDG
jgi:hypothetical protein